MPRGKKKIDPEQVKKLAAINCSYAEMAAVLGCDESTLTRRFAQLIKDSRGIGRMSLKRVMWRKAVDEGNVTMMIWLSKQMLGYSDKVEYQGDVTIDSVDLGTGNPVDEAKPSV